MLEALTRLTDEGLPRFADAVFASPDWIGAMRELSARRDWPRRAMALVESSGVRACRRSFPPKQRCVLETVLSFLGELGGERNVALLASVAAKHPQRELRIYALHGLLAAGPEGIEAAAGPRGRPPDESDVVARELRARAAILRGDSPDEASAGGNGRKRALLDALASDFRFDKRSEEHTSELQSREN